MFFEPLPRPESDLPSLREDFWSLLGRRDPRIDPSSHSLTVADLSKKDSPLIYVNRGFEKMTGYLPVEVVGRNCRFLQGPRTDRKTLRQIREAIAEGRPLLVDILNYRKDASIFWNRLSLRPVFDDEMRPRFYIGIQTDISRMRELEDRMFGHMEELASRPPQHPDARTPD